MIINKVKKYSKGIRNSDSIAENFKDLMMMLTKDTINIEAETKKIQEQNRSIGSAGNLVYHCVESIVKDSTVDHVNCYLGEEDYKNVKPMLLQYSRIVEVNVSKSKSIKGGFDIVIRRLKRDEKISK